MPTWTHEQSKASTSNAVAYNSNVKAGSLLVAACNISGAPSTPTDSLGNTWTLIRSTTTANSQRVAWWYAVANGAGACTVTFTSNSIDGFIVSEWSTAATISLDVEDTAFRTGISSGTDTLSSATVTGTEDESLSLSFVGSDNGGMTDLAAGTGYTLCAQGALLGSAGDRVALEGATVAAGSVTAVWSPTSTTQAQVHIAVFKAPGSTQTILPDADTTTTGWTTTPLWSKINDSSDSTVITATAS